jgi:hypothetical protein
MAVIEVNGKTCTIEPRAPRSGEFFRVRPGADRRKDAWVLDNDLTVDPENNPELWSDIGYWLLADHIAEKLLRDDEYARARALMRQVTIYECASEDGNYFLWAVDKNDADGHEMAKAAETGWVARRAA